MAVLTTIEIAGHTAQDYDDTIRNLAQFMTTAPGFILHSAHRIDTGWCVVEIWESQEASDRFFVQWWAPNLPVGKRPRRKSRELHRLMGLS